MYNNNEAQKIEDQTFNCRACYEIHYRQNQGSLLPGRLEVNNKQGKFRLLIMLCITLLLGVTSTLFSQNITATKSSQIASLIKKKHTHFIDCSTFSKNFPSVYQIQSSELFLKYVDNGPDNKANDIIDKYDTISFSIAKGSQSGGTLFAVWVIDIYDKYKFSVQTDIPIQFLNHENDIKFDKNDNYTSQMNNIVQKTLDLVLKYLDEF
jgi:hypothetical protein